MTKSESEILTRIEDKVDSLEIKLLDPDEGLFARVNENTRWRLKNQRLLNVLLGGILLSIIGLLFFIIKNGFSK